MHFRYDSALLGCAFLHQGVSVWDNYLLHYQIKESMTNAFLNCKNINTNRIIVWHNKLLFASENRKHWMNIKTMASGCGQILCLSVLKPGSYTYMQGLKYMPGSVAE